MENSVLTWDRGVMAVTGARGPDNVPDESQAHGWLI